MRLLLQMKLITVCDYIELKHPSDKMREVGPDLSATNFALPQWRTSYPELHPQQSSVLYPCCADYEEFTCSYW